ncbi:MAG TPA: aldehyde dehydrogenase family protein, partial [Gemmatimonadaceae bacterium]
MSSAPFDGNRRLPPVTNEPIRSYAPGSPERAALKARLAAMEKECPEIPLVIGGKEVRTGDIAKATSPHKHGHVTATWHKARTQDVQAAIKAAAEAQREWSTWRWEDRAAILLKAAELLSTTWRPTMAAATMLGQSKTAFQAEIDATCELIDFWRVNVAFAGELYAEQPLSSQGMWNQTDLRG